MAKPWEFTQMSDDETTASAPLVPQLDQTQLPDAHGLSVDSMRGSEHFIDAPVFQRQNDGRVERLERDDYSFHERRTLALVGRGPDATSISQEIQSLPVGSMPQDVSPVLDRFASILERMDSRMAAMEQNQKDVADRDLTPAPYVATDKPAKWTPAPPDEGTEDAPPVPAVPVPTSDPQTTPVNDPDA